MGHWLARERSVQGEGTVSRFDPRFWTVNFPRPMMAGVVTTGPDALRVDAVFYKADDLAGLVTDLDQVRELLEVIDGISSGDSSGGRL